MRRPVHLLSAHPQRTARYNPRTPSAPSSIETVALQDDGKPQFDDDDKEAAVRRCRKIRGPDNGSRTIEFFSLGRSPPHYFHGFKVGHTTPESRSSPNVIPLRESPCTSPTAPTRYNTTPSPRTDLSDTNEVCPFGECALVLAPKFQWG